MRTLMFGISVVLAATCFFASPVKGEDVPWTFDTLVTEVKDLKKDMGQVKKDVAEIKAAMGMKAASVPSTTTGTAPPRAGAVRVTGTDGKAYDQVTTCVNGVCTTQFLPAMTMSVTSSGIPCPTGGCGNDCKCAAVTGAATEDSGSVMTVAGPVRSFFQNWRERRAARGGLFGLGFLAGSACGQ